MDRLVLSIIIPAYKVEKYLEKCVRSVMSQDIPFSAYEVIVINDGSPDNSLQVAEALANEFTNLRVISQPNGGLSAARNTGMKNAQGMYYMFLDSDDWIAENCLGKLIRKLEDENPDCLVFSAANVINGVPVRRKSYMDETPIQGKKLMRRGVEPCAPFAIWKASFLKEHNLSFYEGIFHEDSEFTPRAYYYAKKVSLTNDIIYYVYQNPNSITRSVNPKKSFDLVNVVCKRLSEFVSEVDTEDRYIYHNLVALYLNNAMANILRSAKEEQLKLNNCLVQNRAFWRSLIKSTILKYRIEGLLFYMFPKNPFCIYRTLQFFHRK